MNSVRLIMKVSGEPSNNSPSREVLIWPVGIFQLTERLHALAEVWIYTTDVKFLTQAGPQRQEARMFFFFLFLF